MNIVFNEANLAMEIQVFLPKLLVAALCSCSSY